MAWKVLNSARAFVSNGKAANDLLLAAGCEVVTSAEFGPILAPQLIEQLADCDAALASSDEYTAEVFQACPNLKVVSRWGVGIDSIDLRAATEAGVIVCNTPGAMAEAVADYTFGLLLAAARRIVEGDRLMRSGGWSEITGTLVFGKTIGLVGAGRIGQAVARRAAGFGMRVLAFDPPLQAIATSAMNLPKMEFVTLEALLAQSDFVCLHAPSLPETKGLIDATRFAQMKPTAYFINTSRGALVNEVDLLAALETGQIAGAAIDVYAHEPLPADHPLRQAPRCVLSPHNSSNAKEAAEAISMMAAENLLTCMLGPKPEHVCNPEVLNSPLRRK